MTHQHSRIPWALVAGPQPGQTVRGAERVLRLGRNAGFAGLMVLSWAAVVAGGPVVGAVLVGGLVGAILADASRRTTPEAQPALVRACGGRVNVTGIGPRGELE